jgi:hypothetical protein
MRCPPGSVPPVSFLQKKKGGNEEAGRTRARTFEEITLLNAELSYAGAEPEEGEAEDGAEQGHVESNL